MLTGGGKKDQVPCPNCYQLNHYNATRCQHCLGDTWRTPTPTEEMSDGATLFWFILVSIGIGLFFGGPVVVVWLGFWGVLWIGQALGLGSGGLWVLALIMLWLIFF